MEKIEQIEALQSQVKELEERLRICDPMRQWGGLRCGETSLKRFLGALFLASSRQKGCLFVKTGSVWADT